MAGACFVEEVQRNCFEADRCLDRCMRAFDFTPVLLVTIVAFVAIAVLQFSASWPDAQHGLLLFEKMCPIHTGNV